MKGLHQVILTGPHKTHLRSMARHRLVRGHEWVGSDRRRRDHAVKSKIEPMKPLDQEIATHEAHGYHPYRDWCRACVACAGRSDARQRRREEQNSLLVASTDCGFFTDGDDGEHTREPLFFWWWKSGRAWWFCSMLVQCEGVEDQAAIKE